MSAQKRNLDLLIRRTRSLSIVAQAITPEIARRVDADLSAVSGLASTDIKKLTTLYEGVLHQLVASVRPKQPLDFYVKITEGDQGDPVKLLYATKHYFDTELFDGWAQHQHRWEMYPPHTRIGISTRVLLPQFGRVLEWRLLEASLFEDLATLWNECVSSNVPVNDEPGAARIPFKRFSAVKQSVVRAAFALIEGYINGLGHDIVLTRPVGALTVKELVVLTEKDEFGAFRPASLKTKLLQYPKIALRKAHPILQETNSTPMAFLLEKERAWRDAIMHPTPRSEMDGGLSREHAYYEVTFEDARSATENAIALIREIDEVLTGMFGRVAIWLHDIGPDGRFPPDVFF